MARQVCTRCIYDETIPARIEEKSFTTLDEVGTSGTSGAVEYQMPKRPGTYEVRLYFFMDDVEDYVYAVTPVTVAPRTPYTSQDITGTWGWFYQLDMTGQRSAEVYQFNQDGTFTLYKSTSIYSKTSVGYTFYSAYELYIRGKYTVSGNRISFSGVQTSGSKNITANGDEYGYGLSFGTRQRAAKVWNLAPTSGYSSTSLNSTEYAVLDANTLGFPGNDAYGSDGYYHYEKNWVR